MNNNLRYPIIIKWSDEDDCFLVGFPDFPGQEWRTHGDTYEEAVKNGLEALESLIISYQQETLYRFLVLYLLITLMQRSVLHDNLFFF